MEAKKLWFTNPLSARARRAREARAWYITMLTPEPSGRLRERWVKWMVLPGSKEAWDDAHALWQLTGEAPSVVRPTAAEIAADDYDGSITVAALERSRAPRVQGEKRFAYPWMALAAAVASMAITLGIVFAALESPIHRSSVVAMYETAAAQHRTVLLEDGSKIHMGARTTLTSTFSAGARIITMDSGEALFEVAHDPQRPFRVVVGHGVVTAIGTAFNVRRLKDLVIVTVTKGTIEVSPAAAAVDGYRDSRARRVTQGEAIRYDGNGHLGEVYAANLDMATAWREGRLQYEGDPLDHVIQDVNRYSGKTVTIVDAAAAATIYVGTVFERDVGDWIGALETTFPKLQVTQPDDHNVIVRTRPEKAR